MSFSYIFCEMSFHSFFFLSIKTGLFVFILLIILEVLYLFWILILCQLSVLATSFPTLWLAFSISLGPFYKQKFSILNDLNSSIFITVCILYDIHFSWLGGPKDSPIMSSYGFYYVAFAFKLLINLKSILTCVLR